MNFNNYTEQELASGVYDLQYNLLYLPVYSETSDSADDYWDANAQSDEGLDTPESEAQPPLDPDDPEALLHEVEDYFQYSYTITSNLLVYDIAKNEKRPLFAPGQLEEGTAINYLFFEQAYDVQKACMLMNLSAADRIRNNFNLPTREPNNRLLIETYHSRKQEYRLWICDKWGAGMELLTAWTGSGNFMWHLDLLNNHVRLMGYTGSVWDIREVEW